MVVLDQFYQIVDAKTSKISTLWKAAHILACIVAAISGFLTAFTFGRVLDDFNYNCVLSPNIVFDNSTFLNSSLNDNGKHPRQIDLASTEWGPSADCTFTQFTPLVMMISAVIWGMYFGFMSRGGAGYPTDLLSKPWTILYPCIFFTIIFVITNVISTQKLKTGMRVFCDQFHSELNNTGCVPAINIYTEQFHSDRKDIIFYDFYPNMQVAIISSDIGIWSWVFQLIICVVRVIFVTDFDLQLVTVMSKEKEEIENVVDFSELDDIDEDV